jgi:hypothetical protein
MAIRTLKEALERYISPEGAAIRDARRRVFLLHETIRRGDSRQWRAWRELHDIVANELNGHLPHSHYWSRDSFKVGGEFLNETVGILTGFQSELCAKFYSARALSKIRACNRTKDPAKKAEPKLVELYIDFLKSKYGERSASVVSEIRRGGISSAAYSSNALGATPYQSWLTETLGSKRSDPDKARNLRLLARGRR